jgi:hypothetical protein
MELPILKVQKGISEVKLSTSEVQNSTSKREAFIDEVMGKREINQKRRF